MNFCSDNVAGAAPEILAALVAAAQGTAPSYGADPVTARLHRRLETLFGTALAAFPVATGTAANALALAALVPPYGAVFCHEGAHINTDECGAPEAMTGGAKLIALPGAHGKLDPATLEAVLRRGHGGGVHHVQPALVSLTQGTEAGTMYQPDEIAAMSAIAHHHGLSVHMDGARFANAVAALGIDAAAASWRVGVDVLSLGATKNGALAAEVVIFFKPEQAHDFGFRRKRAGHLVSKQRFLSSQLDAYFTDDLWLRLAGHANAMAMRLARGLMTIPGAVLINPVEINEIFVALPEPVIAGLLEAGFDFYRWEGSVVRLVTAFNTDPASVDALVVTARRLADRG
ncbi:MAG: beta-eliminating lyase-related protein [Azospirillaceae bacterium]|nr:beta-eliminating lyase-related protein [Azospirillaceae bacterium]